MYNSEEKKLEKFIELRTKYIDMLDNKLITKAEFNHKNNEIFYIINLRPFTVLDSFNKALYNYNYYNSKAKLFLEEEKRLNNLNKKRCKIAQNNKKNCYYHKDISIMSMINLENSEYIEAYYINMHSKSLNKKIFEIYFKNKEKIILHTKNEKIKDLLISKNIFCFEDRVSLIENYINS